MYTAEELRCCLAEAFGDRGIIELLDFVGGGDEVVDDLGVVESPLAYAGWLCLPPNRPAAAEHLHRRDPCHTVTAERPRRSALVVRRYPFCYPRKAARAQISVYW